MARGFTLVELLVALVIMALVVASVPRLLVRGSPVLELEAAARLVRDGLREVRLEAIAQGRATTLELDLAGHRLRLAGGRERPLPARLGLALYTARDELIDQSAGRIRFFPDGSSTGGRVRLQAEGRRIDVLVDWLTGRVRLNYDG